MATTPTPPFNPNDTTKPAITTKPKPPVPTPPPAPIPAPRPAYEYKQRLGSSQGGGAFNWDPANYRRPPRPGTEPPATEPPPATPPPATPPPVPGAGGLNPDGTWTAPDQSYLDGLNNGTIAPKWAGQPGSPEYQSWLNSDQRKAALARGGTTVTPPPPGQPPPGQQPGAPRPPRPNRPNRPGQVSQQAAQALYSQEFNMIPHEFKGQMMELARGGNAQAFNDALFNSNIPHEMKLRLQQLFGFGAPAPAAPAPVAQPQGVPQPPPAQPQGAVAPPPPQGSPYYGAY